MSSDLNRLTSRVVLVGIILCFSVDGYAQQRRPSINFEEFRNVLQSNNSELEKLRQYAKMSILTHRRYPDSLYRFAKEVQELPNISEAQQDGFKNLILALAWRMRNRDSTIYYAERSLDNLKEIDAHKEYFQVATILGREYTINREFVKAEGIYENAKAMISNTEVKIPGATNLYGNLGNLYATVGLHNEAIAMFQKFLEDNDNPGNRCNILSKLSQSLLTLGQVQRANNLLGQCLEYSQLAPPIMATTRSNLASIKERMDEDMEALKLLEQAASISVKHQIPNLRIAQLISLGTKYLELDMMQKADSIRRFIKNNPERRVQPHYKMQQLKFFTHFHQKNNEPEKAIAYADEAIAYAERAGLQQTLIPVYTDKAKVHEQLGELDQAVESLQTQREIEQLYEDRAEKRNLTMMKVRYQLQDKEDQLQDVTTELGTVKVTTAIIILMIFMAGLYVFYRYRMFYLLKEERTRNKIAGDLHDEVSGSLSSISFFAEAIRHEDPSQKDNRFVNLIAESAGDAKDKITDIIWAINPERDSWNDLLAKCHRFASDLLESKGINYTIDLDTHITGMPGLEVKQDFWLIFKEILTNAARHSKALHATISIKEDAGTLHMVIEDNGRGFDAANSNSGNGIKNIQRRAGKIGADINVISKTDNGTRWVMKLPMS